MTQAARCAAMKICGLVSILSFALGSGAGHAQGCDSLPLPSVTLKRFEEPVTTNFEYGYRTLTNIGAALADGPRFVLGLTRGNAVVKVEFKAPGFIDRTGRYECSSPQLTLSYGFSPMTVYVAREFPAGTCAYKQIYEHELRHVRTYQAHLVAIEPELAATLNQRFATGAPWRGPVGQTQGRLQKELEERWIPYLQREINRVKAEQGLIDTPDEYERVSNSCNGEIKKRLAGNPSR
jgi:hypothetical protein